MSSISEQKAKIKKEALARRAGLAPDERANLEKIAVGLVAGLDEFRKAERIMMYFPCGSELDLTPLAKLAAKLGKKIAYPLCEDKNGSMTFREIGDTSELEAGTFGICEPPRDAETVEPKETDLCVVPAAAFDRDGFRLGYGKGYYDRYFARHNCVRVGFSPAEHLLEEAPHDKFDIPVDILLTEKGVAKHNEKI